MTVVTSDYRRLLTKYLGPQRGAVLLLAGVLFSGATLQLVNPQILRAFLDNAQAGYGQAGWGAAALFVAVALAQQALRVVSDYLSKGVGWTATNAMRADLTRHLLRLDMPFHKTHTPGELIERVDGDTFTLASFFSEMALQLIWNGLLIAGILALLFRESWLVGLGLTVYTVAAFFILGALQDFASRRWGASRQADADLASFIEERIVATEDLRALGAEAYTLQRLTPLTNAALSKTRHAFLGSEISYIATRLLFVAGYVLGLGLGVYLYLQGQITIGTVFLFTLYIGMLGEPLENIRRQAQDFQQSSASLVRLGELFALRPSVTDSPTTRLPAGPLAVTFDNVTFRYDDDPPGDGRGTTDDRRQMSDDGQQTTDDERQTGDYALRNIGFALQPGQTLGLLGRTGSGKTTLSRLLFRLYDPMAGSVRLGDVDIRDVTLADLRQRVGIVTQDVQLFEASLRDNLTLFNPHIPDAQLLAVLSELGLGDWLARKAAEAGLAGNLQAVLDLPLASGGQGLSAGEAQLLALTRVFLKDPGLVILDEASSRLDPATERLLERALDRLLAGRTAIVIAHRLQTVQRADTILILDEGGIVEYGAREKLAQDFSSVFAGLLRTGMEEALA